MLSEPIRDPESIELPDEVEQVLDSLNDDGRRDFIAQILAALRSSKTQRDFRPVQDLIDAWYRTMLFVRATSDNDEEELQRNIGEILDRVAAGDYGQTFEELRHELGLPEPSHRGG